MNAAIYNKTFWITETNPRKLFDKINSMIMSSGFNILDTMEHYFSPIGYTAIFLLAESHLAIHTFPEESKTYIELSSCNKIMYDTFIRMFVDEFASIMCK